MSHPVARRYALALYQEAQEKGLADRIDEDMDALRETLDSSHELLSLLRSPVIPRPKKEAVLGRLFEGNVDDLTMRFIKLLVEKAREALLPDVIVAYSALKDERLGVVEAHVRTAKPLGFDEAESLRKALEARSGKKVRMKMDVDPSLVGGLVVRMGDKVFDRSVRHQLQILNAHFQERAFLSQN